MKICCKQCGLYKNSTGLATYEVRLLRNICNIIIIMWEFQYYYSTCSEWGLFTNTHVFVYLINPPPPNQPLFLCRSECHRPPRAPLLNARYDVKIRQPPLAWTTSRKRYWVVILDWFRIEGSLNRFHCYIHSLPSILNPGSEMERTRVKERFCEKEPEWSPVGREVGRWHCCSPSSCCLSVCLSVSWLLIRYGTHHTIALCRESKSSSSHSLLPKQNISLTSHFNCNGTFILYCLLLHTTVIHFRSDAP